MFPARRPILAALCLATALPAWSAPEEDYAAGAKSYAAGDVFTAMPRLKSAADAGHAAAQVLYAQILDRADSDEEAVGYHKLAAEAGNADGQFGYGSMLAAGEGVKRNPEEGRRWIAKAAEQGHKLAINELALAYLKGLLALPEEQRQSAEALRWVRQAADNDFLPAIDALAEAYRTGGYGLVADARAAEDWATKARKARGLLGKKKGGRK